MEIGGLMGGGRGGGLPYEIEAFLEITNDAAQKSWCVYLSFVNKHLLQNNFLNEIWDDCISFNSVGSYNSCIKY